MSEALYLPFDCESGGIGTEISLLSAHFAVCDKDFSVIDELDLKLKPKDVDETGSTIYKVTASALEINKIDLIEHNKVALHPSAAGQELRSFLWKYSSNGKIKLMPVGKNIGGDVKWVNDNLLGSKTWNEFVSYRHYDITTIVTLLKRKGKLDPMAPESLSGLAKFFNIDADWHTARGDNYAGIAVVKKLESLL
jgi:hypothetical protein